MSVRCLQSMKKKYQSKKRLTEYSLLKSTNSRDKMDGDHDIIRARLSVLERRVWTAIGALGAVVVISNPQAIKMMKPLFNSADSVIIQPVVAFVNGSR